ncbi:metallophosphoesterase family protein [Rhizobacter sp. AJA081-3]|uniref:metallophosphoesterase family protein n=1 Tax=Rhizobacter sp. AJA081-3 TaxID=2753607 RepID=UPI001AE08C0A|nr:metallophosphoesterase family protein [Rhizobacter sp. AJA081-3]QTN21502.1 metallophosphoesterase family protein [Rhizobacter sp. AJA081-3]
MLRVGLVSDTHGLLRPEVAEFLHGSHHIIHAGDICDPEILERLSAIAPVTAVRGNNDRGAWSEKLAESELIQLEGTFLYVVHDLAQIDIDPAGAGVHVVVSGHSHKPHVERRGTVLYVNPGSPGPRRFKLPIAAAELLVEDGNVRARVTEFAIQPAP